MLDDTEWDSNTQRSQEAGLSASSRIEVKLDGEAASYRRLLLYRCDSTQRRCLQLFLD